MPLSPDIQPRDATISLASLTKSQMDQEEEQEGSSDLLITSLASNANLGSHTRHLQRPSIDNTQNELESHDSSTVNLADDQKLASSDTLPQSYTTKLESENTNHSSRKGNTKSILSCCSDWKWEMANSAISIIALAATVGTLLPHQNQPLPQWPFHISINTLLSIYSVVLKGSATFVIQSCISQHQWLWMRQKRPLADILRYDSAGRGVWGSSQWLVFKRLQQPLTAAGALIAVLMVAVDPFFQEPLQYTDCQQSLGVKATVARSNYFESTAKFSYSYPLRKEAWYRDYVFFEPPKSAQSSLTAAGMSHTSSVQPYCPTGNCTFESFSTVGYCSTCEDLSHQLIFNNELKSDDSRKASYSCNSMLPTGSNMTFNNDDEHPSMFKGLFRGSTDTNSSGSELSDYQISTPTAFDFIAGKTFWSAGVWLREGMDPTTANYVKECININHHPENEWSCRGYGAARCTIFPCIREYEVNVTAGVVSETMIRHTPFETPRNLSSGRRWNEPVVFVNTSCLSPEERSRLVHEGYSVAQSWLRYNFPWNITGLNQDTSDDFWYDPVAKYPYSMDARGCTYMFGPYLDLTLQTFFRRINFFDGIVAGVWSSGDSIDRTFNSFSGPTELQPLYNSSKVSFAGINQTFENLATGFTNFMRQNGHAGYSAPAEGVVWHYATCLNVHWPWIALPASLVALTSLVLLPLTIVSTSRAEVPVWKAHPLPFILRGPFVDGDSLPDGQGPRPAQSVDSLEDMVKEVRVRLDQAEGEARLVATLGGLGGEVVRRRWVRRSVSLDEYQMG